MEKKSPYYVSMQQVEFHDLAGEKIYLLTELLKKFSIEERIMFLDFNVSQGEFLKTLEMLTSVRNVIIKYFDHEGSVYLQIESRCEFINTWSCFKGDNEKTSDVLIIKASVVLKSMEIREDTDESIAKKIMF